MYELFQRLHPKKNIAQLTENKPPCPVHARRIQGNINKFKTYLMPKGSLTHHKIKFLDPVLPNNIFYLERNKTSKSRELHIMNTGLQDEGTGTTLALRQLDRGL